MARKLTMREPSADASEKNVQRLDRRTVLFKVALEDSIHNDYSFKKMKQSEMKDFQHFLDETVYKGLTISEAEALFLRKKGKSIKYNETINGVERELLHFGKDRTPFRIHGYYNIFGYFVIYKIDPRHKVHRE